MTTRYAFYPGCTLHSTGVEFGASTELVCRALDLEMVEIPDWNCCGASSAPSMNPTLFLALPARNLAQAEALYKALQQAGMKLDYVIEIVLDRDTSKKRIMGRRLCANDNNHPNNIFIDAIKPAKKDGGFVCRVCGGSLSARADDQDESAIDKRHSIYYDTKTGTLSAVNYFKDRVKVLEVDGLPGVKEVSESLLKKLA